MVLILQLLCSDKALRHPWSPPEVNNTILLQDQKPLCLRNILFPIHYLTPLKIFWHTYAKERGGNHRLIFQVIAITAYFKITILNTSSLLPSSYTTIVVY